MYSGKNEVHMRDALKEKLLYSIRLKNVRVIKGLNSFSIC